ncbi:cupredoxin family copper-binding protein [Streptomyces sp. GESEQ-35]|uniref:cupredoxin domain-containing protein n=1 Tax=Streptomyces sp. GESEQ-35 TaxID=2812657 RepID=UPI0027E2EC52|nr:cupredoxin family copper-binding protein [Streptomyces sp. GESEQ-35]
MKAARWAALSAVLALVTLLMAVPGEASAATYRVTMQGYAFSPANLTVPAGSTVTWTNQDTAPHDVKTTSGPVSIHSPMLDKGESWSFTFGTAGAYGYYCTVHPDMTAGITVRAAAPATSAAPTPAHTHQETGSGRQHDEHQETATVRPTASSKAPASPSSSPTPSMVMPTSTAAPAVPAASPSTAAAAPQTQPVASARPLDPLLLLAGIVAGVAVLCLLLVGSRAAAPRGRDET